MPGGWSINILEFAYSKTSDDSHDLSQFQTIVNLTLVLLIPVDHDIYSTLKNSSLTNQLVNCTENKIVISYTIALKIK